MERYASFHYFSTTKMPMNEVIVKFRNYKIPCLRLFVSGLKLRLKKRFSC